MTRNLTCLSILLVFLTACAKSESTPASSSELAGAAPTSSASAGVEPPPGEPDAPMPETGEVVIATSSAITDTDIAAAPRIEPRHAWELIQAGQAVIVDVRSREQFDSERIAGSMNIPLWDLEERARSELDPTRWVITSCT